MADYRLSAHHLPLRRQVRRRRCGLPGREQILDERTGDIKDYPRRHRSVLYTQILTPENAPEWMHDRQRLWNGVEHREDESTRRGTAQLARDIQLSLPSRTDP
jgi:hypothetical protein